MITPRFRLEQTAENLIIIINATFVRISDVEINIYNNIFLFYSSPYFLRLTLPGNLIDSEAENYDVKYEADERSFTIVCKKENNGEVFNGLDMLTELLKTKGSEKISKPLIEVLNSSEIEEEDVEDDQFNWLTEQTIPEDDLLSGFKYGFANSHSGVFTTLKDELSGVVDVLNPDTKSYLSRREERKAAEVENFDNDHYLADLFDNDDIDPYLEYNPKFNEVKWNTGEQEALLKLPRKELLIDSQSRLPVFTSLFDIIYAWCYNHRITLGENCSESAWNIQKISPTLSWLDSFGSLKEASIACMKRSLIFPLARNWELASKVLSDTQLVFSIGKKQILKCLLEIQKLFNNYEPYYLLNQLYITDYCVFIQSVKDERISSLSDSILKLSVTKEDMKLDLISLENAAKFVIEEEKQLEGYSNIDDLSNSMGHLSVIQNYFAEIEENSHYSGFVLPNGTEKSSVSSCDSSSENSSSDSDTSGSDSSSVESLD